MMYKILCCYRRVLAGCFEAYRGRSSAADGRCQNLCSGLVFCRVKGTAENIGYGGMLE